jgi:Flp pilus assembly protein TadG
MNHHRPVPPGRPARRRLGPVALRSCRGQAAVELVGLLPLLAAVALGAFTAVAAQAAREQAAQGAEAGAVALLQARDPEEAARAAVPHRRARVAVDGHRVTVAVRPRVPLLGARLEAKVTADAGPEPTP